MSAVWGQAKEWSHFQGQIEIQRIVALRNVQAQSVSRFDGVDVVRWGQHPAFRTKEEAMIAQVVVRIRHADAEHDSSPEFFQIRDQDMR